MKKNLWGFVVIALAIGISLLQSYTVKSKFKHSTDQTTYNWYPVNSSNQISSTTAVFSGVTKASAISSSSTCKDDVSPNCLYGTNGSVTVGQDISGEPAAQRILKKQ